MTAQWAVALVLGVLAAAEDLRSRCVPNWLTGAAVIAAVLVAIGGGWHALARTAAGSAVGFAILLPLYALGGMGGGDIKLMAAFGALLGPSATVEAAVFGAVLGGVVAAAARIFAPKVRSIPYAPVLVLGSWVALWGGGAHAF